MAESKLRAHWPLHSEAGVLDAVGDSNGVLEPPSGPVWDDGLRFNGHMRVEIFPSATLTNVLGGSFTACAWIRAGPHQGCRVLSNRGGGKGFEIVAPRASSKKVTLWLGNDHRNIGVTDVDDNEWHHLVVTFQEPVASEVQVGLYVDGKWDLPSKDPARFRVPHHTPLVSDAPMCIGDWKGHPGHGYEGHIRDVMIFEGYFRKTR
mmetsp:Transcript_16161/g.38537  ORF Transcript_16161/g.38537 Transcript_16161/m.38537 type:complete len:205 (+) Transcript_16161:154-768(+)